MAEVNSCKISVLARELKLTTRAIRFYEQKGLLFPERSGTQRMYSPQDRVRLELIVRGKRLGFSLSECRELIELYDPSSGNTKQLNCLLERIVYRRHQLKQQLLDIERIQWELDMAEHRCRAALQGRQTP
ncbi:MerR family transcriptional regulator [Stutzerimonas chloritidismutans]|uniref:MerR family transcriptional regulator n=1 Tax=Stutzerimonas chloritidismutans TaxID=203192 RepID=UPI003F13BBCD